MKITEIEWLKNPFHQEMLSYEDCRELDELGVFQMIRQTELQLNASNFVYTFKRLSKILEPYMKHEEIAAKIGNLDQEVHQDDWDEMCAIFDKEREGNNSEEHIEDYVRRRLTYQEAVTFFEKLSHLRTW